MLCCAGANSHLICCATVLISPRPVLQGMYGCISGRLAAQDQDQEVKEAAIMAMAALIAQLGDVLQAEVRDTDCSPTVGGVRGGGAIDYQCFASLMCFLFVAVVVV